MSGELKLNLNAKAFVPKKSYQNNNQQNMPNQFMGYDNMNNNQFGGYYQNQYGMPMQQPYGYREQNKFTSETNMICDVISAGGSDKDIIDCTAVETCDKKCVG